MCCSWRTLFNLKLIFIQQIPCADCSSVWVCFLLALTYRRLDPWLDDLILLILKEYDNSTLLVLLALKYYDHLAIWSSGLSKPGVTLLILNSVAQVAVVSWVQLKWRQISWNDQRLPDFCVPQVTQREGVQLRTFHSDSARFIFFYILM